MTGREGAVLSYISFCAMIYFPWFSPSERHEQTRDLGPLVEFYGCLFYFCLFWICLGVLSLVSLMLLMICFFFCVLSDTFNIIIT